MLDLLPFRDRRPRPWRWRPFGMQDQNASAAAMSRRKGRLVRTAILFASSTALTAASLGAFSLSPTGMVVSPVGAQTERPNAAKIPNPASGGPSSDVAGSEQSINQRAAANQALRREKLGMHPNYILRREARKFEKRQRRREQVLEEERGRGRSRANRIREATVPQVGFKQNVVKYPSRRPARQAEDGSRHEALWQGQVGRCFYCLKPISNWCSIDHFVPFSKRTSKEHAAGKASDMSLLVVCCKAMNSRLADRDTNTRMALSFPGNSMQVGGGRLFPRAQPLDCPNAPATAPDLLLARHRFVRNYLSSVAADPNNNHSAALIELLFSPPGTAPEPEPDASERNKIAARRARVEAVLEEGRAALKALGAIEEEIGESGLVARSAEFADNVFDKRLQTLDDVIKPYRESSDVDNRFNLHWSEELGHHIERCDMRWNLLEEIPIWRDEEISSEDAAAPCAPAEESG